MKIVIIGGVAGGATAAARLRRLDEDAEIIILERSGFVSYANCGLPYYIGGEIRNKEHLTLQTPDSFWNRFRIKVRVRNEVIAIHPGKHCVTVRSLDDGTEYEEHYDKLLLSPGSAAIRPELPGIDSEHIFTLRTVEDTLKIRDYLDRCAPSRAVVVGGGFIGLEMAENLTRQGISVTLIEKLDQVMAPLDYDMACTLHSYLKDQGIDLKLGQGALRFSKQDGGLVTSLEDGEMLKSDFVILAIGVKPDTSLAKAAGLTLGIRNAIVVNDKMETSAPDVYAVGDAVEISNFVTKEKGLVPLAGPANKQGRVAADNMAGRDSRYRGTQGSSVLKLFDMTAAATGINERTAQAAGLAYDKAVLYSASHATYYPGATNMTIKVLFQPDDGKLLGAQIVGFDGVDKRIDVLAAAIRGGLSAEDLTELELAYAPPYSSAKDPVNMMGYVIENLQNGTVKQFHWHEFRTLPQDGSVLFLDTQTEAEYQRGHLPGAVNIPLDELRDRLAELDPDKTVYVNCYSRLRSYIACRILSQHGFDCYNLSGGYRFFETVTGGKADTLPTYPCGMKIAEIGGEEAIS